MNITDKSNSVIYTCPYVPAEWIAAHGIVPRRILPSAQKIKSCNITVEGLCPFAAAFASEIMQAEDFRAYIVTTLCDQMRRIFEIVSQNTSAPGFLMNVPNTWQTEAARDNYTYELKRLGSFLTKLTGITADEKNLSEIMIEHNTARNSKSSAQIDACENKAADNIPIAIIGGPMTKEDFGIFDFLETLGARIVLNGTENDSRTMPRPFNTDRIHDNPFEELVDAYFGYIPDASRRPDSQLYKWLDRQLNLTKPKGIILWRYLWCDMWHAQARRLRSFCSIPVLELDASGNGCAANVRIRQKVSAFLEMLR